MLGNSVHFIGRMTHTPELKVSGDHQILNFSLARDRYNPKGEDSVTDFINFVAFGKNAENIAKYISKGAKVGIEGHLVSNTYDSKKFTDSNGNNAKITRIDVIVDNFEFLDSKKNSDASNSAVDTSSNTVEDDDDDMPF